MQSLITVTCIPADWIARTADSRPAPAPWTRTSTSCIPFDTAWRAASWATIVAANAAGTSASGQTGDASNASDDDIVDAEIVDDAEGGEQS